MNSRSTARSCKTCRIRREAIVRTVVALSQALKLRIIAEGVEHATQVDALVANG
jgi:EAL domain-containing protein (putative c-di-GMP-specific phosphodiesterase class I)